MAKRRGAVIGFVLVTALSLAFSVKVGERLTKILKEIPLANPSPGLVGDFFKDSVMRPRNISGKELSLFFVIAPIGLSLAAGFLFTSCWKNRAGFLCHRIAEARLRLTHFLHKPSINFVVLYWPKAEELKMPTSLPEIYRQAVDLWRQIHPVWAGIGVAFGALTTAFIKYRDVKKWIVDKHDGKVLRFLLEARRTAQVNMRPGHTALFLPFPFQEIVKDTGRSEKSVRRTMRRLEDRGEAHEVRDGWNLGPRQDALTLANIERRTVMPSRWSGNRFNRGRT